MNGTAWRLWQVWARSFVIQATWNFKGMLHWGFLWALTPVLRHVHRTDAAQRAALDRHAAFFNTHPIMACYILGITARLEEECGDPTGGGAVAEIERVKHRLSHLLGAIGDRLFWQHLRSTATALGIAVCVLWPAPGGLAALPAAAWGTGVVVCLLAYNAPHLYYRTRGVFHGYRAARDLVRHVDTRGMQRLVELVGAAGCAAVAALMTGEAGRLAAGSPASLFIFLVGAAVYLVLHHRGHLPVTALGAAVGGSLALAGLVVLWT